MMKTSVLNISAPLRMTFCPPNLKLRTLLTAEAKASVATSVAKTSVSQMSVAQISVAKTSLAKTVANTVASFFKVSKEHAGDI